MQVQSSIHQNKSVTPLKNWSTESTDIFFAWPQERVTKCVKLPLAKNTEPPRKGAVRFPEKVQSKGTSAGG